MAEGEGEYRELGPEDMEEVTEGAPLEQRTFTQPEMHPTPERARYEEIVNRLAGRALGDLDEAERDLLRDAPHVESLIKERFGRLRESQLQIIKEHAGERAEIEANLERRGQVDELTGMWKFKAAVQLYERVLEQAQEGPDDEVTVVAAADLDHFSKVNNMYGHPQGDAVLAGLAEELRTKCRAEDVFCRKGGEEFVFVFPRVKGSMVTALMEKVRGIVGEVKRGPKGSKEGNTPLTASMGVKVIPKGEEPFLEDVVKEIDKACYEAKRQGRDRWIDCDSPSLAEVSSNLQYFLAKVEDEHKQDLLEAEGRGGESLERTRGALTILAEERFNEARRSKKKGKEAAVA